MTATRPPEGVTACPRCATHVVVVHDPPVVIEVATAASREWPSSSEPTHRQHDSARCRRIRADQWRAIRPFLERSSFGCPFTPGCGGLLSEHGHDGHDSNGDLINPRCPEGT